MNIFKVTLGCIAPTLGLNPPLQLAASATFEAGVLKRNISLHVQPGGGGLGLQGHIPVLCIIQNSRQQGARFVQIKATCASIASHVPLKHVWFYWFALETT